MSLKNKTAIVGVGATEFSKNSGRSELRLALEAITAALAGAGMKASELDGVTSFTMDNVSEIDLAQNLGVPEWKYITRTPHGGGGGCALLQQAAVAITAGVCKAVLCYRAMNERSQYRFGQSFGQIDGRLNTDVASALFHGLHGIRTAAGTAAMMARRYMHDFGATVKDFGQIAISARKHAATNPNAWFYGKPLTMEGYLSARMIVDPLRLFDCCQESDGAVAFIVTSAERARDLRAQPILISAAAQGSGYGQMVMNSFYTRQISRTMETDVVAKQLYETAGLSPKDMDVAIIYDHFGPTVMMSLESFGFCPIGGAKDFIKNGNIELGGTLPVNTHGGQIGEAYIHGMNGIAEAVRQLRGSAVNQVANAEHVLVSSGPLLPTSGAILSRS